jgi:membrane associated rhomboid family serine protease
MPIRLTPAVKVLLIACVAAFVVQQTGDQFLGTHIMGTLALVPDAFINHFRFWQLFTYVFMHGEVMHLFLNLMMLAFIGGELEATWGTPRFLRYFFLCSTAAGLFYLLLNVFVSGGGGLHLQMVGASGAIYGLLMAYGLIFGERVLLFMMLFPMKAKYFVWILAAIEFFSTVFSGRGGLASAAHLGGMAAGFAYLWGRAAWSVYRKRRQGASEFGAAPRKPKKKKTPKHLRLVINNDPESADEDEANPKPPTWH